MNIKRIVLGAVTGALLAVYLAPAAIAAYNAPTASFGPLTGDCTTTSAGSTATTCTKTNNTPFGTFATANQNAAAITGGTINGTAIGATTPSTGAFTGVTSTGPVTTTGDIGATQTITTTSGTVSSTAAGTTVGMVYVNSPTAAVALAGPTNLVPGSHFTIKDGGGAASTNNITYTPGAGITIDGAATFVVNQNREAVNVWVISSTVQAIY